MATDYGAEFVANLETLYFVTAVLVTAELVTLVWAKTELLTADLKQLLFEE